MSTTKRPHNKLIIIGNATAGALALGLMANSMAAPGTLADSPLFLKNGSVQPNIFFMIDDSGSMDWENLASKGALDSSISPITSGNLIFNPANQRRAMALCPGFNVMAYNPAVTYTPWWGKDSAGVTYANQTWPNARGNPYNTGTTNLTNHYYMIWNDANGDGEFQDGECPVATVADGDVDTVAECQGLGTSICVALNDPATTTADQDNYANWYSYYRKREYVAKRALSQIISESTSRAGLATINGRDTNSLTGDNADIFSLIADIDDITTPVNATAATDKEDLLESLFRINSRHGTPLRLALERVGKYYDAADNIWSDEPILSAADGGECQQNFAILMSDGQWNGGDPSTGNTDADGAGPFDGGDYADTYSDTLADVAMKYYETDLSTLADKVPVITGTDDNDAQHMVTYTVAFGINGELEADELPGEINFTDWGDEPTANSPETIDDMIHAAFNGRGQFLSAKDPQSLITSLGGYISDIQSRTSTAAAVSFNSTSLQAGTRIFQATFDPSRWSGDLLAKDIVIDAGTGVATISGTAWTASSGTEPAATGGIDGRTPASRQLITYDSVAGNGITFDWSSLNSAQKNDLRTDSSGSIDTEASGLARLAYIRGERSCEVSGPSACSHPSGTETVTDSSSFSSQSLRQRDSALGDIVHSSPFFVGPPSTPYPNSIEPTAPYSTFAIANNTRAGMTYFGSNDGMLHALDENGEEVFAYIPESLFSTTANEGLHYLSDPSYAHRYYVDLSPTVQDAYIDVGGGTPVWSTILVGALRGGGKGLFAMDITDPSALTSNAENKVLWEFTNADLGYTFSDIRIGKMNTGEWAAVFGNGYNNDPNGDGHAKLFILYLDGSNSGTPIIIDTGAGSLDTTSQDCDNALSDCNGLATPKLVDLNGNGTIDRIYAGDLHGNLWAFDVSDTDTANWVSAYSPNPLFQACTATPCTSDNRQPITVEPDVEIHPYQSSITTAPNLLVFFGTGQYLTQTDNATNQQQSFYGVWDSNAGNLERDTLVSQTITTTNDATLGNVRTISQNAVPYSGTEKGWFIDFPVSGERSVTNPLAFGSIVFFNTVIPTASNSNMCSVGGSGWLMAVDLLTGGMPAFIPIDINNDGVFDSNDQLASVTVVGTESNGVPAESRFISNKRVTADSTGSINIENVQPGPPKVPARMSWSELDAP